MPKSLFLPGYSLNSQLDSQDATILIGWYTFIIHFLATFYFLDIQRGNDSTWIPSPIFEYSNESMRSISLMLSVFSIMFMIFSLGLIRGVKKETRIYYFPWFFATAAEILLLFYQAFCLWWRYSYDANTCLALVVLLIFAVYNTYLYLIVLSNYRYLKQIQSPTLIFPPDMN